MKESLLTLLIFLISAGQPLPGTQQDSRPQDSMDAQQKLREFLPRLQPFEAKYPNDVEIQLGLAILYQDYAPSESFWSKGEQLLEAVLATDPDNKPASVLRSIRVSSLQLEVKLARFQEFQRKIDFDRQRGITETKIDQANRLYGWLQDQGLTEPIVQWTETDTDRYEPLYQWLQDQGLTEIRAQMPEGRGFALIKDPDAALRAARQRLDSEIPATMAELDKAQSKDPDNAFYNYLKAYLYFRFGQPDNAVRQIEQGVQKKYLNNYTVETHQAMARVLREADFPQAQRDYVENRCPMLGDFTLTRSLDELAKSYEAEGDSAGAEKMYNLMIGIARHVREAPARYPEETSEKISQYIEEKAKKAIDRLHGNPVNEKTEDPPAAAEPQKPPSGRNTLGIARYAPVTALCAVMIAAVVVMLLKRKPGPSRH